MATLLCGHGFGPQIMILFTLASNNSKSRVPNIALDKVGAGTFGRSSLNVAVMNVMKFVLWRFAEIDFKTIRQHAKEPVFRAICTGAMLSPAAMQHRDDDVPITYPWRNHLGYWSHVMWLCDERLEKLPVPHNPVEARFGWGASPDQVAWMSKAAAAVWRVRHGAEQRWCNCSCLGPPARPLHKFLLLLTWDIAAFFSKACALFELAAYWLSPVDVGFFGAGALHWQGRSSLSIYLKYLNHVWWHTNWSTVERSENEIGIVVSATLSRNIAKCDETDLTPKRMVQKTHRNTLPTKSQTKLGLDDQIMRYHKNSWEDAAARALLGYWTPRIPPCTVPEQSFATWQCGAACHHLQASVNEEDQHQKSQELEVQHLSSAPLVGLADKL